MIIGLVSTLPVMIAASITIVAVMDPVNCARLLTTTEELTTKLIISPYYFSVPATRKQPGNNP